MNLKCKFKNKWTLIKIILMFFILKTQLSFAQNSVSLIPGIPVYDKADSSVQVPLLINNVVQDNSQKIEAAVSEEIKEQVKEAPNNQINEQSVPNKIESATANPSDVDFKAFMDKKNFLKDNKAEPSLWQGASLVVGFISLIGILAYILTRMNRKGIFKNTKNEKVMDILSTLSINSKRQVMLIKVRDREFVISNTEGGIEFLTDVTPLQTQKESVFEKKAFQITDYVKSISSGEIEKEKQIVQAEKKPSLNEKKSEILMKALKRMDKVEDTVKPIQNEEIKNQNVDANGKFPKYFSNIFENEAKKEITVKKKEEVDSVENVTNLIREKLRSMKPLN